MPAYLVILTGPAKVDLADLAKYIAQDSPHAAEEISQSIGSAISSLAYMPKRHIQAGVAGKKRFPVHRLVVSPYLIYYRVETGSVYVLTVRHGARRQLKWFD